MLPKQLSSRAFSNTTRFNRESKDQCRILRTEQTRLTVRDVLHTAREGEGVLQRMLSKKTVD